MTHKRYPLIPKFFQPKVAPSLALTTQLYHWGYLDKLVSGKADESLLWDWIEAGMSYSEMMRLLMADGVSFTTEAQSAIKAVLEIQPGVQARFLRTGKVGLDGRELAIARAAALVMDELIALDRHGIAWASRQWSNAQVEKVKKRLAKPMDMCAVSY